MKKTSLISIVFLLAGFSHAGAHAEEIAQDTQTKPIIFQSASIDLPAVRSQIFALINNERLKSDDRISPIHPSDKLSHIAQTYADDMVSRHYFNHVDPDGNTCKERAKRLKLSSPHAESILSGVISADEAVEEFMSDPPRAQNSSRANILNPEFRSLGIGVAQKPSGTLVVVLEFSKSL